MSIKMKCSRILFFFLIVNVIILDSIYSQISKQDFKKPNIKYRPVPLWFWNNSAVEKEELVLQFRMMIQKDGYGGCGILPFGENFSPKYLSDDYFACYKAIIDEAKKLGASMSLYDEYGFPTGSMGAINGNNIPRFMQLHPEKTIKRLDKQEYCVLPDTYVEYTVPAGHLMSVVAMDTITYERISLKRYINADKLQWRSPKTGAWKIMFFVCVKDGDPNVDYLDPEAVRLFTQDVHQCYYERYSKSFGPVITETFFDEPTMYRANGRMWTTDFNEKFELCYNESPELLYPALWYDIGKDTQYARNRLFGFRARLYAEGFMRTISDWAASHGILSTGHQDQEEVLNPVSISGDLMLCGKYMGIPGIDKIGGDRPAERFYKVISSSAYNWDKELVMSETYGAMGNLCKDEMYRIAIEQYAKGINKLIPHAVWYDEKNVTFLPELSWRNPLYQDFLPEFNLFLSRLNYILQRKGKHVADIAVYYPIETLQGEHYLDGKLGYYRGGVDIPQTDYTEISTMLTDSLGRDFTYLHPEVLDGKCVVEEDLLKMCNEYNSETYQVLILPGIKTISLNNLQKIEDFYRQGGKVIFTTRLPEKSVEQGMDQYVQAIVSRMVINDSINKGKTCFIPYPTPENMKRALSLLDYNPDVVYESSDIALTYIHKEYEDCSVFYFANLNDKDFHGKISFQSEMFPDLYDPHTGNIFHPKAEYRNGRTFICLDLEAAKSIFILSSRKVTRD